MADPNTLTPVPEHKQGGLWCQDRPGGGAAFIVELPLATIAEVVAGDSPMPPPRQPVR